MAGKIQLPPPPDGKADVVFVAGEHSGDQHAALIAGELGEAHPDWHIAAYGGPALQAKGVQLLHDLTRNSVVGLVEVLKHYGYFKELFNALIDWIEEFQPRVIILVDYPGFNLRLAEALMKRGISRKGGGNVVVYQYVSPQIWAWKGKRRFKMAQVLDELGVIFPFEPECYADTDLDVHFVGHPFAGEDYRNPLRYDPSGPVLLLPGSRKQAVGRIFPVMVDAYKVYQESGGSRPCVCLYPEDEIRSILEESLNLNEIPEDTIQLKPVAAGTACSVVLTSSGTMSLNCALAGIPGAIVYRAHPLTTWIGRKLVKIDWLGITNLILEREVYPEYIQANADPDVLGKLLQEWSLDPEIRNRFGRDAELLKEKIKGEPTQSVVQRIQALTSA